MSRIITRTIYGSALQTSRHLGLQHAITEFSTLNTAINNSAIIDNLPSAINAGMWVRPDYNQANDSGNLKLNIFCIGNGGHRFIQGPDPQEPAYVDPIPHRSTDSGAYRLIPFVVKRLDVGDLPSGQQANYRLRRTLMINIDSVDVLCAAYFGKVLDLGDTAPEMELVTIADGIAVPSTFEPTINNLKPTKPSDSTVVANEGSYASVAATLQIAFTAQEVTWLQEAMTLLYGNPNYAIISEVLLCSGVDKATTAVYNDAGVTTSAFTTGTEAVGVEVSTFASVFYPVVFANNGFNFTMNLGATEPLFGVSA